MLLNSFCQNGSKVQNGQLLTFRPLKKTFQSNQSNSYVYMLISVILRKIHVKNKIKYWNIDPSPHKVYADDDLKVGIFKSSTATWNSGAKIILRNMLWELIYMKPNPFSDITIMTLTDYDIHTIRFYIHIYYPNFKIYFRNQGKFLTVQQSNIERTSRIK